MENRTVAVSKNCTAVEVQQNIPVGSKVHLDAQSKATDEPTKSLDHVDSVSLLGSEQILKINFHFIKLIFFLVNTYFESWPTIVVGEADESKRAAKLILEMK